MSARRLAWFASDAGKKAVFMGISCVGTGLLCAHILPNTFFLDKYKGIIQMYRLGVEVPVPPNVLEMVDEVMDDLNIPPFHRKLIKPFTIFGFDIFHAGTTTSKYGSILGIPSTFSYKSATDVDRRNILVKNELVNWSSKEGQDLEASLVLSEEAIKFALGREIVASQNIQPYLNGFFPVGVWLIVYSTTHNINNRLQLLMRPVSLRGVLYSIVGLFGYGMWSFLKDFTNVYYETQVDKEMSKLGEEYIKGGVEFYTKTLQRNIALRSLMGKDGESLYSTSGNEVFLLRQKRLPLIARKSFMELKLNDLISEETS